MATPSAPNFRLTPYEVEGSVSEYLDKLSHAVANPLFDPNGSVHAIVFGEWGHGKTQILYRTANYLQKESPHVLTIKIIPEVMKATELLREVHSSCKELFPKNLNILEAGLKTVSKYSDSSVEGMEFAAKILADLSEQSGHLHTALLFDEVQTMNRKNFQAFLRELERSYRVKHLCIHTMQCHSLATLDDTRKIRLELGNWLQRAYVLHLPSIEMTDAHYFFKQRISDCGGDESAQRMISEGISKTLCMATGGNPRKMLILAREIYQLVLKESYEKFNGDLVVKVLSTQPGPKSGSRLLMLDRLNRVLNLFPQVFSENDGNLIANFLQDNFSQLYAERREYSATDLVNILNVEADFLQLLHRPIEEDLPIFVSEEDEILEVTKYRLSDQFRRYLSESFSSSGGIDVKTRQYGILLNPTFYQTGVTTSIAHILRNFGFAVKPPIIEALGEFENGSPIRGYTILSMVENVPLYANVLITCLFGAEPPQDMLKKLAQGLRDRKWLRVFIFFDHPEFSWEQWSEVPKKKHPFWI